MNLADDKAAGAFGPVVKEQKIKNLRAYPFLLNNLYYARYKKALPRTWHPACLVCLQITYIFKEY